MRNVFLCLACCFSLSNSFSQDTIYKRNNEIVVAQLIEINPTEVKYKKFNFQDGPTYVDQRSELKKICYANGTKEEFGSESMIVVQNPPSAPFPPSSPSNTDYYIKDPIINTKIEMVGNKFKYKGMFISEKEAHIKMYGTKDSKIVEFTRQAQKEKGFQYIGFLAIPAGIAAYGLFLLGADDIYNSNTNTYSPNPNKGTYSFIAGLCGAIAIACPIKSIMSKENRNSANRQAVKLYNAKY